MKRLFLAAVIALYAAVSASAQESRHAVEITTGYPCVLFQFEFPWLGKGEDLGKVLDKEYYQPGLNVGYTFSWGKRWELSAQLNGHLTMYEMAEYPEVPGGDPYDLDYDFDAEPVGRERFTEFNGAAAVSVRFKWLVRENYCLYSALGAGVAFVAPRIPCPYIAPIGIKFGKGRVYGIVEANFTPLTCIGMAGIGVRL